MKFYNKSKKAIGYITLTTIFMIILPILVYFFISNPVEASLIKTDFGETTKAVDLMLSKLPAEELYKKESIKNLLEESKISFAHDSRLPNCFLSQNIPVWYNQKLIDSMNSGNYSNETKKYSNCLPDFGNNIEEKLSNYLKEKLDESQTTISNSLETSSKSNVIYNETTKSFLIEASNSFQESSNVGSVYYESNYEHKYSFETYPQLLKILEKAIPKIPDNIENNVPICVKNNLNEDNIENIELYCIETNIKEILKNEGSNQIWENYQINVNLIETPYGDEYYGVKIEIININLEKKELEFALVLKDNIPYYLINFKLNNFGGADNIISVSIEEPKFSNEGIANYVVLYSYKNFFSKSYNKYDELINLLKENKIPNKFKDTGFTNNNIKYYHTDKELGLNLALISNKDFEEIEENGLNKKIKNVLLYQAYNFETNNYEPLKNQNLFVYVFAVDKVFNYYVEEIENSARAIIPLPQFGPQPLIYNDNQNIANTIEFNGEIDGEQSSFTFNTKGYTDNTFDHFDIYIIDSDENLQGVEKECNEVNNCYYYNGFSNLREKEVTYLISSYTIDNKILEKLKIKKNILTTSFTPQLNLKNNHKYKVLVVPVDKNGNGILKFTQSNLGLVKKGDFYELAETNIKYRPQFATIEIKDNKLPDVMNSFSLIGNPQLKSDNNLYISWDSIDSINEEIDKLYVEYKMYTDTQGIDNVGSGNYLVLKTDNKISNDPISPNVNYIKINKIIPLDTSTQMSSTIYYDGSFMIFSQYATSYNDNTHQTEWYRN